MRDRAGRVPPPALARSGRTVPHACERSESDEMVTGVSSAVLLQRPVELVSRPITCLITPVPFSPMTHARRLRLLTVLLALMTLPGLMGSARAADCSTQVSGASSHLVMSADCCPLHAHHGVPCKRMGNHPLSGKGARCSACLGCGGSQSPGLAEAVVMLAVPVGSILSAYPPQLLSSRSPTGLWRPPQLI